MLGSTLENAYPSYPIQPNGFSTNNKYSGFPPLMSDGRSVVAGYTPESVMNKRIIQEYGITNNSQYRQFMTTNANKIREENFALAANDIGYTLRSLDVSK